jgi:manganese/zinc/iron transport system substrate-binding protein
MKFARIKVLLCAVPLLLLCVLSSCGKTAQRGHSPLEKWMTRDGKLKVLSTTAMIDDLVGRIGGEKIDHLSLIVGEIDPHNYELVKGDDEKFSQADILFHNGLGLEHGASLRYRVEHHPNALGLGDQIREIYPEKILYRNNSIDPHVWMDVELWSLTVDPIVDALSQKLPQEAAYFQAQGEVLKKEMLKTHDKMMDLFRKIPQQKRYLVTSHDAFQYFTHVYLSEEQEEDWQKRFAAPEGLVPEGQISPVDIQSVVDYLLRYRITYVFAESNISKDALRKIVEACRGYGHLIEIAKEPLYGDAMGSSNEGADSYLEMMWHNAKILAETWEREEKE